MLTAPVPRPWRSRLLRRAAAVLALTTVATFSGSRSMAADALTDLELPPALRLESAAVAGTGRATLTTPAAAPGSTVATSVRLDLQAETLGEYIENWELQGAVFDCLLPSPIAIPAASAKLALAARTDSPYVKLKLLIRDARGGMYAVNTRLAGLGGVPRSAAPEWIETFRWDSHEMGRLEPWTVQTLDPAVHDYFDPPQAPLALVGFRATVSKADTKATIEIARLLPVGGTARPDPYWHLNPENAWTHRLKLNVSGRHGWGPAEPGPYLRAGDLRLPKGACTVNWEILDREKWTVIASGATPWAIADATDTFALPLLPQGLYHLRLAITRPDWKEPREANLQYMVVRNSRGPGLDLPAAEPKPLSISGPGNIVAAPTGNAKVEYRLQISAANPGDSIAWEAADTAGKVLGQGSLAAVGTLDLQPYLAAEPVVWLTARLQRDGRTVDILRRAIGVRAADPVLAGPVDPATPRKFASLDGQIRVTRGDWEEGASAIATKFDTYLPQFQEWFDESKDVGYNIVEIPATWYDVEPLPGVYDFTAVDRIVAEAKARGLFVVIRVHPRETLVPDWVPRELQEDENGLIDGLWQGGTNLTYTPGSVALRHYLNAYLERVGARYRDEPAVVGYTLSNLFFDHGWHDMPWLNQFVGYSDASRRAFVADLRAEYSGDLAAVAAAHARPYHSWEDIAVPHPKLSYDAHARLVPRIDRLWLDWAAHKNRALRDFRIGGIDALRRGDPLAEVGLYRSTDVAFSADAYVEAGAFIAQGSMEDQYPPDLNRFHCRFEPHGKVARTAELVDVGMTNLLFHQPGYNSFFNYWKMDWTMANVTPDIVAAENRLKHWCTILPALTGSTPVATETGRKGAWINALQSLIYVQQHTFSSRLEDLNKPFLFRRGAEKVPMDEMNDVELSPAALAGRPWVYLPYAADVLTPQQLAAIDAYVRDGGTLVVEATSGLRSLGDPATAAFVHGLGLPEALPVAGPAAADREVLDLAAGGATSPLRGLDLALRTRNWNPPVSTQPTAWIHNIPRAYLRPYRFAGPLPAAAQTLATVDGAPAAVLLPVGKGRVLAFVGVLDWAASPGLVRRLDQWARGEAFDATIPADPDILSCPLVKGTTLLAVGRRFIDHNLLGSLKKGTVPPALAERRPFAVTLPQADATVAAYQVRDLLSGADFGVKSGDVLRTVGVELTLAPGEGFVLQATPVESAK